MAKPAGSAYDHLEAESQREQLELLRAANAELQREHAVNAGALDSLPPQMEAIDDKLRRQMEASMNCFAVAGSLRSNV